MKKIVALLLVALMLSTAVFAGEMLVIAPNPNAGKTVTVRVESPDIPAACVAFVGSPAQLLGHLFVIFGPVFTQFPQKLGKVFSAD